MDDFVLPKRLTDKIFEIKRNDGYVSIISYFPLSDTEKNQLKKLFGKKLVCDGFRSIFSDSVSDEEWKKSKSQIKKRFQDELFEID
ncbi:hypothetical protein NsoK4_04865 [Nitrosopumilus sp. K4]|uniref:hypothetical protein n=1 Tax=Nitrosopumilus sp. K4 TaxID=2795383 RepID=UPI001BAB8D1C|nr:hypothetical protein [Nitrosopumilus sp. K4]QUC65567.1 hypothetical protein NsoK4_04865 [Nitrosopumilus sp. K4]